ncbi:hypothetical protein DENSPDRAFT_885021 [Dentipellis sp. KUC8613]|nr:hypothetical protein DENSPDRAFT_885021 [Dentipellis sp. KUC8613]
MREPGIPGSRLPVPAHAPAVAPCRAPVAPRPRRRYPPPCRHPAHLFPPALASSHPCRAPSRPVMSLLHPVAPVAPVAPQCASVVPPSCPLAPLSHTPPLCRVAPLLSPALALSRPVAPCRAPVACRPCRPAPPSMRSPLRSPLPPARPSLPSASPAALHHLRATVRHAPAAPPFYWQGPRAAISAAALPSPAIATVRRVLCYPTPAAPRLLRLDFGPLVPPRTPH